jgi:hypothetical protein
MAAIIALSARATGAAFSQTLRFFRPTACRPVYPTPTVTGVGYVFRSLLTSPKPVTRSVPMERPLVTLRNPARHGVTPMAPQDFPLCAAFQEE